MEEVCAQLNSQALEYVQGRLVKTQSTSACICMSEAEDNKELVDMQSVLPGPVDTVYKLIQSGGSLLDHELQQADWELKQMYALKGALHIWADGLMIIHLGPPGRQCQLGKHGKPTTTTGRRRLHVGRPWQVVAIDLVGPMPKTPRGNS